MPAISKARRNSILTAAAIAVALVVWILSGVVASTPAPAERISTADHLDDAISVRTMHSKAREIQRTITASARTEPDRGIELKAETEGRIIAIGAERGARVSAGQRLVEIEMRDRQGRLTETEALIRQRQLEFEAGQQLLDRDFISPAELAGREAALESARAARERILLDIGHTRIDAPFDSVIYDRLVEIGDYVGIGDPVMELLDVDPLIVVADINERESGTIRVDSVGTAVLRDGTRLEGRVRYMAPAASESTRSFRVELAVPNPDFALSVGTSAQMLLGAETLRVHRLPPSILWLADDGTIGVKIVDNASRARFIPVDIIDSTADSMLVTGLPEEATVITVGQAFVIDGQSVQPTG